MEPHLAVPVESPTPPATHPTSWSRHQIGWGSPYQNGLALCNGNTRGLWWSSETYPDPWEPDFLGLGGCGSAQVWWKGQDSGLKWGQDK